MFLELLLPGHRDIIRPLARDERIWEYNKMLLIDDNFDKMFDDYFNAALDKQLMGGQQSFAIRRIKDRSVIGMTRLYEINQKDKSATIGYTWYIPSVWGKVHNKECKLLLLQHIFEDAKIHACRIESRTSKYTFTKSGRKNWRRKRRDYCANMDTATMAQ